MVEPLEEGHLPVMVREVLEALAPRPGGLHVDATFGGGGHAVRILEASAPDGRLLGIDADPAAIARGRARVAGFGERATLRQANFERLEEVARDAGFMPCDGVLLDLGLSSYQLAAGDRGFSFRSTGPLDMRFDPETGEPASALLARLDEAEIARILREYGEEPQARRIARAIAAERDGRAVASADRLAALVERVAPGPPAARRRIHPATRVFQALRIAVNRELTVLPVALDAALRVLRPGGRLVVIAYHSLEDRIVKRFLVAQRRGCVCPPELPICVCGRAPTVRLLGALQRPTEAEVTENARARSARLRAAVRLPDAASE